MFKNENLNDEMIDILADIHEHYLPCEKVVYKDGSESSHILTQLFLGGDQLTEERARNAQKGHADGDTTFERLEGILPKVEDWHAGRILYQVLKKHGGSPNILLGSRAEI
ncbi:Hypothetical predicted protein [Paramuricea clavata]|uniref:Uncharacterized protein n=1 Tax=Paramuricea clavata TaxID=317549 RepID=A0A6S7FJ87_PARCT|nr:Hypothetical predicted protein [Paramuricea clavata]